jgi:hypothetical protein
VELYQGSRVHQNRRRVLPHPTNPDEAHFFAGDQYVLANVKDDKIVNGPKPITDNWPPLKKASFY